MKDLLRQIIEELENVHVVASSDRLFELVEKAKAALEEDSHELPAVEDITLGDAASDAILERLRKIRESMEDTVRAIKDQRRR